MAEQMIWRKTSVVFALALGASAVQAKASSGTSGLDPNPPLGERKYHINIEEPYDATTIVPKEKKSSGAYLKDPIMPDEVRPGSVAKKQKILEEKPKRLLTIMPAKLNFRKVSISGKLKIPRIEFDRENLDVNRADEPLPGGFLEKIFEPTRVDQF